MKSKSSSALLLALGCLTMFVIGCSEIGIQIPTATPPSGIRGTVVLGPTCPGSTDPGADDPVPCLTPYAASLVILDSEGGRVQSITSGNDGKFQVDLAPGDYVVTPVPGTDPYPIAQPVSVTVAAGDFVDVEINYDTGIR